MTRKVTTFKPSAAEGDAGKFYPVLLRFVDGKPNGRVNLTTDPCPTFGDAMVIAQQKLMSTAVAHAQEIKRMSIQAVDAASNPED